MLLSLSIGTDGVSRCPNNLRMFSRFVTRSMAYDAFLPQGYKPYGKRGAVSTIMYNQPIDKMRQ